MKAAIASLGVLVVSLTLVLGQPVITTLDGIGNLTWTNLATNATYRVEWATSLPGPWKSFDALTNLLSIQAATNSISVQVPRFYRVVWTDPPPPDPAGTFIYALYDAGRSSLLLTGRWDLKWTRSYSAPPITGRWTMQGVADGWRGFAKSGQVVGYTNGPGLELTTLDAFDDNWWFHGNSYGNSYSGHWEWIGWDVLAAGTFVAQKVSP